MKLYREVLFAAVLSACMISTVGCGESKYKEALAQNRRIRETLETSQQNEALLRQEKQQLAGELAKRDSLLTARQEEIRLLTNARDDLQKSLSDLNALYQKLAARGPSSIGPLPGVLNQALQELAATSPELMDYLPKYGMVKLKADLTFQSGSVDVKADAVAALGRLVEIMNTPAAKEFNVYIAGHTDDMPIGKPATRRRHPNNWYLSVHRAVSVEEVMEAAGLAPARLAAMGFGEYHPVAPNAAGKKGNALNRRVEIWIVPADRFVTVTAGK